MNKLDRPREESNVPWIAHLKSGLSESSAMEEPTMKQETVEVMGEMPEIIVVSDAVEGIST